MMLPTTRGVSSAGPSREGVGIKPDLASSAKDAPTEARRAALAQLLQDRPDDVLAGKWRKLLAEMAPKTLSNADGKAGS